MFYCVFVQASRSLETNSTEKQSDSTCVASVAAIALDVGIDLANNGHVDVEVSGLNMYNQ